MQVNVQFFLQRRNGRGKSWQLFALLAALTLLLIGSTTFASAQTPPGQTYWLGRLDGTEYVFDTRLPAAVADAINAADPRAFVVDKAPKEFPPLTADGTDYSFVKTRLSWDNTMFDRGQISLVGVDGTWGAKWFNRDKDSAEGKALAEQLTAQATAMSPGSAWHAADVLLLVAPNTATAAPAVRLSIFGGQERYWLGRPDGTEYVFDTPLPPDFVAKVIAADANKWVVDKTPREFPPQNVDGTDYSFVTTQITYDKPQFDKGELALVRKPGKNDMLWLDGHLNSAVGEPLARQLSAPIAGEWKSDDMVILISSNAETPALRVPIPATTLAKIKMKELGQQTQAGLYYPTVKAPADLDAFRAQMLAYGNAGRRDPDFRKVNGSKTATDLSGDTVQTMKGVEKVFKHSQTPPYFADHVLNDKLNEMAQFQAEYTALNRITDITMHNGPTSFTDPKTGKSGNMYDLGDRAKFFGISAMLGEAGAGKHELGSAPHVWMASDTHFRPWFNVSGCQDEIGYGAAQDRDGKWYFIAVAIVDQDPDCVNATVAPTAEPTAATTAEPTAEATAEPTAEPTAEATAEEPSPAPAQADRFPLLPGQTVEREQKIPSESGNHYLIFQPDSNVVVYTADDQYVWGLQSITDAYTRTQSVQVENDGNFVVRDANGEHIWSALTENPDASAYLTLTPEGVLRLVSGDSGATLWASDGDLSPVAPTAEPTVAATAEPTGEEAGEATPEPTVEPAAEATAEATPEPAGEAAAESTPEPADDSTAEATPEATDETAAEPAGEDAHGESTEPPATVTDGDGNVYPTVQIGDQLWMAQNLRTTTCSDGAAIPLVSDKDAWVTLTDAAYTWGSDVADDAQAQADYGALYNAHAAALPCNVCPSGWRVPSLADFQTLLDSQGADAHLKLSDPAFWGPDSQATNASGWSARPAGGDGGDTPGSYDFGQFAYFWSTTPNTEDTNNLMVIHGADAGAQGIAGLRYGFSIRCVQDLPPADAPATAAHAVHWAYEGEAGPENWGELDDAYAACSAGLTQSPIDITTPAADDLANLVIAYRPSPLRVRNNGHTVVANYAAGSFIEVDGQRYIVDSLHYHAPSEHIVDGNAFDAELHIVHREGKDLAVIGILLKEGAENPAYQALLDNLPGAEGPAVNTGVTFNAADLLPEVQTTYRYSGSLTTPPCSEGVRWLVMTTPVELSATQLADFQAVFAGNARPVQPLNERELVEDTTP
jgi:carbonic anhydrase